MTVWVIETENEGCLCCVSSFKAGKQYLLREGYVDKDTSISDEDCKELGNYEPYGLNPTFEEVYGENWKEHFLQYDYEKMADLEFFITEREIIEEE